MGMPVMPDIHLPTVAATQAPAEDVPLAELIRRKEGLESELSALGSVLDSHGVNMNTSLVSFDGYPRSDIDVAQIRTTRARIIYLRNDLKALMARIEAGLHAHFAAKRDNPSHGTPVPALPGSPTTASQHASRDTSSSNASNGASSAGPAFAAVNTVSPSSPASQAGLVAGDKIQRFGDATWFNHEKLTRVAQIVGRSEGQNISVTVLRRRDGSAGAEEQLVLTLRPSRDWGGRGLLGCHLLPL